MSDPSISGSPQENEPIQEPLRSPPPRPEPAAAPRYCLRCRTPLPPSTYHDLTLQCPRCRLCSDPNDPATYTTQPMFMRWRYWVPGFCLAVVIGIGAYAFILWTGQIGYALF